MPVRLRRRVLLGVGVALLAGGAATAALMVAWDVRVEYLPEVIRIEDPEAVAEVQAEEGALGLTCEQRRQIQGSLAASGFDAGSADGSFGPRTREAIRGWQAGRNTEATGYLTERQARALMGDGSAGEPCLEALSGP